MKTLRHCLLPLVTLSSLCVASPPRLYVTGQVGLFEADAGSFEEAGLTSAPGLPGGSIKSGTKIFDELSVGADFNGWFSLEAGVAYFAAFSSPQLSAFPFAYDAPLFQKVYRLRSFRIGPVVSLALNERLVLRLLGGFSHSELDVTTRAWDFAWGGGYLGERTERRNADSYHAGAGLAYRLTRSVIAEARFAYYDFGSFAKTAFFGPAPSSPGHRISAVGYSLGLSWHF
jgi:hypothetical protein